MIGGPPCASCLQYGQDVTDCRKKKVKTVPHPQGNQHVAPQEQLGIPPNVAQQEKHGTGMVQDTGPTEEKQHIHKDK